MGMDWSPKSATNAYVDTLQLCNNDTKLPDGSEFISALAAGMSAKLIVEISSEVSQSTIALAVAARQTGGRLVCILPETNRLECRQVIRDTGLTDMVEFRTGDPIELLPQLENIDFSLVDCKTDNYSRFLRLLDVNPRKSVVVANNLAGGRKGLGGHVTGMSKDKIVVRSMQHLIGKGMEITVIGKRCNEFKRRDRRDGGERCISERRKVLVKRPIKSNWVVKIDEESGEEHFFRMPQSQ